jgi:hypothetical protein
VGEEKCVEDINVKPEERKQLESLSVDGRMI